MPTGVHQPEVPALAPERPGRIPWPIVGLLMALCFLSHMNRVGMSVAGNQRIMDQFGFSPTQMGMVYSAFLLVYTVCMIPAGWFIDRFGSRVALSVMGFGSAIFGALTGAVGFGFVLSAQPLLTLVVIRGAMGLLTAPLHPGCARAVNHQVPLPCRNWANGLVTGAALLGIACTYRAFGALIDAIDWPGALVVISASNAILAGLWLWFSAARTSPDTSPGKAELGLQSRSMRHDASGGTPAESWRSLVTHSSLLLLTLSYAAVGYFQYLFFYWMQYYFDQVLHLGKTAGQDYATLPPLAMAIGMPLGGLLSDRLQRAFGLRFGRALVPVAGLIGSAVFLFLGILAQEPVWIVVWFSLALGVMGAGEGSFWSTAVELGGKRGGAAAAIMNTGGNGGGMLAPVVTPWVSEHFGWPVGIGLSAFVCLGGALCWLWIDPSANKPATKTRGTGPGATQVH